ncbi:hypothetical protein [Succinatimonas hippei]|uniref:hypothetical protein n=1 Tax=Succinatimonas hippei TaxID=626938 RepID=UPI0026F3085F|nr:hypothetical protein [Succinatimonas hippei]
MAITNEQIDTFLKDVEKEIKELDAINEATRKQIETMAPTLDITADDKAKAEELLTQIKSETQKSVNERVFAFKNKLGIEDKPKVSLSSRRGSHNLV